MEDSKKYTLSQSDWKKAGITALQFFSIPLGFYVTAVLGVIQLDGHHFSLQDLVPSTFVINSVVTWAFMQLLGILKRFNSGK